MFSPLKKNTCFKEKHGMELDMFCINYECQFRGPLCHKCFLENQHNHLGSELIPFTKFIEKFQQKIESIENSSEVCEIEEKIDSEFSEKIHKINTSKNFLYHEVLKIFKNLEDKEKQNVKEMKMKCKRENKKFCEKTEEYKKILAKLKNEKRTMNDYQIDQIFNFLILNKVPEIDFKEIKQICKMDKMQFQDSIKKISKLFENANIENFTSNVEESNSNLFKNSVLKPSVKLSDISNKMSPKSKKKSAILFHNKEDIKNKENFDFPCSPKFGFNYEKIQKKVKLNEEQIEENFTNFCTYSRFSNFDELELFKYLEFNAICFKVDSLTKLLGFGHFNIIKPLKCCPLLDFSIWEQSEDNFRFNNGVFSGGKKICEESEFELGGKNKNSTIVKVFLKKQLVLEIGKVYSLKVMNKTRSSDFYTKKGILGDNFDSPFHFFKVNQENSKATRNFKEGQIPELYFN